MKEKRLHFTIECSKKCILNQQGSLVLEFSSKRISLPVASVGKCTTPISATDTSKCKSQATLHLTSDHDDHASFVSTTHVAHTLCAMDKTPTTAYRKNPFLSLKSLMCLKDELFIKRLCKKIPNIDLADRMLLLKIWSKRKARHNSPNL